MPKPPPDTFEDTAGIVYDTDAAMRFVRSLTGIDEDTCGTFFASASRYELGLGLYSSVDDAQAREMFGTTPGELRERFPACFPPARIEERYLDPRLQRLFIAIDTGLDELTIRRMQDAEWEYRHQLGLLVQVRVPLNEQTWTTVRSSGRPSRFRPVTVAADAWLDLADFADAVCWVDVPTSED